MSSELEELIETGEIKNHCRNTATSTLPCMVNGILYDTVKEAAEANGIHLDSLRGMIKKYNTVEIYYQSRYVPYVVDGVTYPTREAAAKALGLHSNTLKSRLIRQIQEIPPNKREVEIDGVKYESIAAAARAIGISADTLRDRLDHSYENVPLSAPPQKKLPIPVVVDGVQYESFSDAERKIGIASKWLRTLHKRQGSTGNVTIPPRTRQFGDTIKPVVSLKIRPPRPKPVLAIDLIRNNELKQTNTEMVT